MVARSELILRWSVYGAAGLLVCLVQGLILQRLDLWGVMPFLYPALAAMVAVWEGAVPRGAVYALCAFLPQVHFLTYPPVKVAVGVALALTAFGIIDLGAAAASNYFHKQPWTFLICGIAMIALANVIVPMISRAGARKANSLLLDRFVKTVADDKGIKVESAVGAREFEWGFCEEAVDLADHVALRFGERSVVVFDKHGLKPEEIDWLLSYGGTR